MVDDTGKWHWRGGDRGSDWLRIHDGRWHCVTNSLGGDRECISFVGGTIHVHSVCGSAPVVSRHGGVGGIMSGDPGRGSSGVNPRAFRGCWGIRAYGFTGVRSITIGIATPATITLRIFKAEDAVLNYTWGRTWEEGTGE